MLFFQLLRAWNMIQVIEGKILCQWLIWRETKFSSSSREVRFIKDSRHRESTAVFYAFRVTWSEQLRLGNDIEMHWRPLIFHKGYHDRSIVDLKLDTYSVLSTLLEFYADLFGGSCDLLPFWTICRSFVMWLHLPWRQFPFNSTINALRWVQEDSHSGVPPTYPSLRPAFITD